MESLKNICLCLYIFVLSVGQFLESLANGDFVLLQEVRELVFWHIVCSSARGLLRVRGSASLGPVRLGGRGRVHGRAPGHGHGQGRQGPALDHRDLVGLHGQAVDRKSVV